MSAVVRVLLALGAAVHAGSVAALVAVLALDGPWSSITAATVGVVAGGIWTVVLYETAEQRAAEVVAPVQFRRVA